MRKKLLVIISFVFLFISLNSTAFAQTRKWEDLQTDPGFASREYGCVIDDVATIRGIECIVANALSVAVVLIGLAGFGMMIYGALKYQVSGGSKGAESARNILTYAVIGLVLALSSYFILNILAEFTGISLITRFQIPEIQ